MRVARPRIVGVISSPAELATAVALSRPPDLFELRLDALYPVLPEVSRQLVRLGAPLIITARHPAEGGRHQLSDALRREILLHYLPRAAYVDVELRAAAPLGDVLGLARARKIERIISVHELEHAANSKRLEEFARAAEVLTPSVIKIAARTDAADELKTLDDFFERTKKRAPLSVMGVGKLGRESRLRFARAGSVLNYAHLGTPTVAGQLSLVELRQALCEAR